MGDLTWRRAGPRGTGAKWAIMCRLRTTNGFDGKFLIVVFSGGECSFAGDVVRCDSRSTGQSRILMIRYQRPAKYGRCPAFFAKLQLKYFGTFFFSLPQARNTIGTCRAIRMSIVARAHHLRVLHC